MNNLVRSLHAYHFLEVVNRVCLIPTVSSLSTSAAGKTDTDSTPKGTLHSCNFEVFGTVQGVYFRKYTKNQATQLNLVGWVQNTIRDTVEGYMEGEKTNVDQMKQWLEKTGSPRAKITEVQFRNEKPISKLSGNSFDVRR